MTRNKKLGILVHKPNKYLDKIIELVDCGKVIPVIDKSYTLDEVPKALPYFRKGLVKGKIVIRVRHD
jgi:NADPH:quinone reductase-like Zn-dependent oxidoreductase